MFAKLVYKYYLGFSGKKEKALGSCYPWSLWRMSYKLEKNIIVSSTQEKEDLCGHIQKIRLTIIISGRTSQTIR